MYRHLVLYIICLRFKLTLNPNIIRVHHGDVSTEVARTNICLTSIPSSIREFEREEGKFFGGGSKLYLSAVVLKPHVGYGGVEVFSSRRTTGEGIVILSQH